MCRCCCVLRFLLLLAFISMQLTAAHLRYDNKLISRWSRFPWGSFVCKILALNWHVDIIKLMKCNYNEREGAAYAAAEMKGPFLLDMLIHKSALNLYSRGIGNGYESPQMHIQTLHWPMRCEIPVWMGDANFQTDYIASNAVMIWQFICAEPYDQSLMHG